MQAFVGKACDRTCTPWHMSATSKVCEILHALITLKWEVVNASSAGFYDELNVQCLLFLPIFNI